MALRIASKIHAQLIAYAAAKPQQEVCGLIFGRARLVEGIELTANVAAAPERRFEIDPARLIAVQREERVGGPALLGFFHSHPNGAAEPSECDADMALPDGKIWLIIAGQVVTAWQAVEQGHLHGRFDPLPILQC